MQERVHSKWAFCCLPRSQWTFKRLSVQIMTAKTYCWRNSSATLSTASLYVNLFSESPFCSPFYRKIDRDFSMQQQNKLSENINLYKVSTTKFLFKTSKSVIYIKMVKVSRSRNKIVMPKLLPKSEQMNFFLCWKAAT